MSDLPGTWLLVGTSYPDRNAIAMSKRAHFFPDAESLSLCHLRRGGFVGTNGVRAVGTPTTEPHCPACRNEKTRVEARTIELQS